jgi:AbiV family abortive infection protein
MEADRNHSSLGREEGIAMLRELVMGSAKILENAVDLHHEAVALHTAGALSRALFLHQISLEECAKIEMLGAWAVSMLMGIEGDSRKQAVAFASHKAKNYTNAYLLPATKAEKDARREKRWEEAMEAFKAQQIAFHQESNSRKNASLYVDMQNGTFVAPKDRITDTTVTTIADANAEFLAGADARVDMMTRWLRDPEKVQDLLQGLGKRLTEGLNRSDDPEQAMAVLLDEMLARAEKAGYVDTFVSPDEDDERSMSS